MEISHKYDMKKKYCDKSAKKLLFNLLNSSAFFIIDCGEIESKHFMYQWTIFIQYQ